MKFAALKFKLSSFLLVAGITTCAPLMSAQTWTLLGPPSLH
jgi:hypothetical protein